MTVVQLLIGLATLVVRDMADPHAFAFTSSSQRSQRRSQAEVVGRLDHSSGDARQHLDDAKIRFTLLGDSHGEFRHRSAISTTINGYEYE
jgi:hypothetical protein